MGAEARGLRWAASMPSAHPALELHALPKAPPLQGLLLQALHCPISGELMTDAVCLADGHSYQNSVVTLAPGAQSASSSSQVRARAVPNLALREICRRVARGETPCLQWSVFGSPGSTAGAQLLSPCLDETGRSVPGGPLPRQALSRSMAQGVRGPLPSQPRPNLALERVIDVLLAHELPLHAAVLRGELAALPPRALRNSCLQTDAHGQSALMLAAKYGDVATVEHLLQLGANPLQLNHARQTPLLVAMERGHQEVAARLAATRQALDHADTFRMFPLLQAVVGRKPLPEMIGVLCAHGAPADQRDGITALQAATWVGSTQAMRALCRANANPNLPRSHAAAAGVPRSRHGAPLVPQYQSPKLMAAMPLDFEALDILQPPARRPKPLGLFSPASHN